MEYKDYYKILGVNRDANERDIKRAYRRLARQFHPDVNPGDQRAEEKFKEINEAYEVLGDPDKRTRYDGLGDPGHFDWSQWATGGPGGAGADMFSEFFRAIFGGMGGGAGRTRATEDLFRRAASQRTRPGQEVQVPLEITLEEAFHGTTRVLEQDGHRVRIKIPQGARSGSKIRYAGKGGPGYQGGPSGDLHLTITVKPHPVFMREENDDLRCDVNVDLYTAVLGGEVRLSTLDGEISLKIPAGTNSGKTFRLRGKGMPHPGDPTQHGDLLAAAQIQVPQALTTRERELFEELARLKERK